MSKKKGRGSRKRIRLLDHNKIKTEKKKKIHTPIKAVVGKNFCYCCLAFKMSPLGIPLSQVKGNIPASVTRHAVGSPFNAALNP